MSVVMERDLSTAKVMTKKRFLIVVVVALLNFIAWLDESAFNALTPIWSAAYKLDAVQIGKVGSAFMLGYFPALFLAGPIADRLGSKWVLFITHIGVLITAAMMMFATSYELIYLRNVVFGVCAGIIWGPSMRWLALWLPINDRLRYGGSIFVGGAQLAVALAAPLALGLSTIIDWKQVFIIVTLVGIPVLFLILWTTETPEQKKGISQQELAYIYSDRVSAEQLKAEEFSWSALGKVFKNPSVWTICIASGFIVGASWITTIWSSYAYMNGYGLSPERTSMLMFAGTIAALVIGLVGAPAVSSMFGGNLRHALAVAPLLGGVGYLAAGLFETHYLLFVILNTVFGLGMCGIWFGNLGAYLASLEKPEFGGTLNGIAAGMSVLFGYLLILQSGKWINPAVKGIASMSKIYVYGGIFCLLTILFIYMSKSITVKVKAD